MARKYRKPNGQVTPKLDHIRLAWRHLAKKPRTMPGSDAWQVQLQALEMLGLSSEHAKVLAAMRSLGMSPVLPGSDAWHATQRRLESFGISFSPSLRGMLSKLYTAMKGKGCADMSTSNRSDSYHEKAVRKWGNAKTTKGEEVGGMFRAHVMGSRSFGKAQDKTQFKKPFSKDGY